MGATASLIAVDTDTGLLTETHECAAGDLLTMQDDELVRNVAGRLQALLQERERVAAARQTNPNVYETVQLAVWHHHRFDRENNSLARAALQQAEGAGPPGRADCTA